MQVSEYFSKIDVWLIAALLISVVLVIFTNVHAAISLKRRYGIFATTFPVMLTCIIITFMGYAVLGIKYTVSDEMVTIRTGFKDESIPLVKISRIEASNDTASSPALSLDRLKITYNDVHGASEILISPSNRITFCKDIFARIERVHKLNNEPQAGLSCGSV